MQNTINYLRTYRKQTAIKQTDIAFLLDIKNNSSLAKCENGTSSPPLKTILMYHLLFDTPVLAFFSNQRELLRETALTKIEALIQHLKTFEQNDRVKARIEYLEQSLVRLTNEKM